MFLRLGHADTDEQLQDVISKFLPPVLLKLSSAQEGVRKKVSPPRGHFHTADPKPLVLTVPEVRTSTVVGVMFLLQQCGRHLKKKKGRGGALAKVVVRPNVKSSDVVYE